MRAHQLSLGLASVAACAAVTSSAPEARAEQPSDGVLVEPATEQAPPPSGAGPGDDAPHVVFVGPAPSSSRVDAFEPPITESRATRAAVSAGSLLPLREFRIGFLTTIGPGFLTDSAAKSQGLGATAFSLHVGVEIDVLDIVTTAFSYGWLWPQDEAGFSQDVTFNSDGSGPGFRVGSTPLLHAASLAAGLRTPVLAFSDTPAEYRSTGAYLVARVGYAWVGGGRSITDCVDCTETSIALSNGAVLDPGLRFVIQRSKHIAYDIVIDYRQYLAGSMAREVAVGLALSGLGAER